MIRFPKPSASEWRGFLVLMPLLSLLLNNVFFGSALWTDYRVMLFSFPLVISVGGFAWYGQIMVMQLLRQLFPLVNQTSLRLVLLAFSHLLITVFTFFLIVFTYDSLQFLEYALRPGTYIFLVILAVALTMIATTFWEADYTFKQWKDSVAEKEKLQQMTLSQEFHTLKSQVNPHFLFNCFNTLSSLIAEDPAQAELFLDELSKVYRYLLRNNQNELCTLQTEIGFIESYYRLLQTRHGSAVQIKIETDKKYAHYLLPSLTLQLLVENAVKHNVLSRNKPLVIDIFTTPGNRLAVNNNLQRRSIQKFSNKVGLTNIQHKYDLLGQPGFQVLEDEKNFCVVLPLIWNQANEKTYLSQNVLNESL
jgi:two-component system, LytTR family, sensor kinase